MSSLVLQRSIFVLRRAFLRLLAQSSCVCLHFASCHVPTNCVRVALSAVQTFLCGGSKLPFGSGAIPFRETLACGIRSFFRMRIVFASVGCATTSQKVLKIPLREWRAIRFRESLEVI